MKRIFLIGYLLILWNINAQEKPQDTIRINEVIIDVAKNNQKLQQIPISVTAVTAKEIELQKIDDVTDLNGLIPNFFIPEHGTKYNTKIYVRGIGVKTGDPSVGTYVDDIPYFDNGSFNFEFGEIKRIEVLRGPQGTLYGRNTMGGLIKIYTPDPVQRKKASIRFDYGSFNQYKGNISYNQPVSDKSAFLVNGYYKNDDGYFVNQFDGKKVDAEEIYGGRIKYKIDFSDNFNLKFIGNYEKNQQAGFAYGLYDPDSKIFQEVNYNDPSKYDREFGSVGLNLKYYKQNYEINFASSFQQLKDTYIIDQDFTPLEIYFGDQRRDNKVFVQELNIKSTNDSQFQWIGGIFAFQRSLFKNLDLTINTTSGKMILAKDYDTDINGYAAFGQASYKYNKFLFTGGIRYDYEESTLDYKYDLIMNGGEIPMEKFIHSLSFDQVLPKISISYFPADNFTIYATIAKGYNAGGFNSTIERPEDETYDSETSLNYEIGYKLKALKNKLILNTSIFYIDWDNQQVTLPVPSGRGIMVKNAGKSESKGFEIESMYHITSDFNIGLNYGLTDAKFISYKYDTTTDYSNNKLPLVPEYTLGIIANYKWRLKSDKIKYILFNTNYNRYGKYYWTPENAVYQDPYGVLNININIEMYKATLGFWAKNLTNEEFVKYYFSLTTLNNSYAQISRPTSFGVFFKYNFL